MESRSSGDWFALVAIYPLRRDLLDIIVACVISSRVRCSTRSLLRGAETATMVLGESYLKGILRAPLADVKALPPNPPHPFQTDLGFYLRQRFFKHHFPLVFGFAVAIWVFSKADQGMRNAKKKASAVVLLAAAWPLGLL